MPLEYKWKAALVASIAVALSLLDNTIVSIALPAMKTTFGTDYATITWVGAAYFLTEAAALGVAGYIGEWFGTRTVYLLAMVIFTVASILCTFAPSAAILVVFRAIQGVGAGLLWPVSFAIAYRAFPSVERGRALAVIGVPVLLAPALGPVVGGYLTTTFGWPAIFLINAPLGVVAFVAAALVLRRRREDELPEDESVADRRFDVWGFVLAMASFTLLISGLTEAGSKGWTNPLVDALLAAGTALLFSFVIVELRTRYAVLDLQLFRNNTFARANVLLWILVAFYYGGVYLIPYFFESVRGYSAMTSGEILLGQGIASAVGIALAGTLYNRFGPRPFAVAGAVALVVSTWGLTGVGIDTSGLQLQPFLLLRGLGIGLTTPALQNLALAVVNRAALARASSLVSVTQQVAGAAGLGSLASYLAAETASHTVTLRARAVVSPATDACRAGSPTSCLHHQALSLGLDNAFGVMLVGYVVCLVLAAIVGTDPTLAGLRSQHAREVSLT